MIKANDFNNITENIAKEKFAEMVNIQERFIKENMKQGKRSVLFIFSDIEYFHSKTEKTWFNTFKQEAKELFKKQGFNINGVLISW